MIILTSFTDSGSPKTGLTPIIRIRNASNGALIITDEEMVEIGDGSYTYNFISYDKDISYSIRCDGRGTLSLSDRYTFAGNESFVEDIEKIVLDSETNIRGGSDTLDTLSDQVDTVQADLDNPDQYKADVSSIASDVWDKNLTDHMTSGSFGEAFSLVLGLSQNNMRMTNQVYNSAQQLLTAIIKIYRNAEDLEADENNIAEYTVTAAYNSDHNLNSYKLVKV